jgi:GDP-D-mannose 3', 5'-epimerase
MRILIAGSSGFIGSNLTSKFQSQGHEVRGVDIVEPIYVEPDEFVKIDLSQHETTLGFEIGPNLYDEIYILACCMGGMGYIGDEEKHGYEIGVGSTKIVTKMIDYCRMALKPQKVFYSSSACVYPEFLQTDSNVASLRERDAIPAQPDLLYGWQKLYAEKMFQASGLNYRIARFHNIFGRYGSYDNGKEKAPAALIRKAILADDGGEIEVWGSGEQTRSFLHIDTCLDGVERLMQSEYNKPLNIGSDECVSINELAEMVIDISGKNLTIKNVPGNVGVQGRNSDNTLCKQVLGWSPDTKLIDGLRQTYSWIQSQIKK